MIWLLAHCGRVKLTRFRDWLCDEARRAFDQIGAGGFRSEVRAHLVGAVPGNVPARSL